jgi:hypothetical protein
MARPCGCGGGGLTVRCSNGVRCSGLGTTTDPLVISWEIPLGTTACNAVMDCIGTHLAPGLQMSSGTRALGIKLDPDPNNLAKLSAAGLLVSGTVTPGSGGASVAKLLTLPAPVIGGMYGGGSSVWPEGTTYTYEQAAELVPEGLQIVHVPVRRTSELLPVALYSDTMSWYNPAYNDAVLNMDAMQLDQVDVLPSGPSDQPDTGYFGFGARQQQSVPWLSNVFNILGNKVVLYLESKDVFSAISTADRIKGMAPGWDMTKSIIAAGEPIPEGGPHATLMHAVVDSMTGTGIPVAAHMTTSAQVRAYNGAALKALGIGWVSVPYAVIDDEGPDYVTGAVQDYKDNGLQVMVHTIHRQWQYQKAAALNVRGVLCFDHVYGAGVRSGYRYRRNSGAYAWPAPSYGLHSPYSATLAGQRDHFRGYIRSSGRGELVYDADLQNPGVNGGWDYSGYWVLNGRMGPFINADTYYMQCWVRWNALLSDKGRWIGLWADRPTDRNLVDWAVSDKFTIGYNLVLNQRGEMVCAQYDGTPGGGQEPPPGRYDVFYGNSGYGPVNANWAYGIRLEVEPTQIRGYRIGTTPGVVNKTLVFTFTNTHPKWARYISGANKGYPFFGRHFFEPAVSTEVRIIQPSVGYTFT